MLLHCKCLHINRIKFYLLVHFIFFKIYLWGGEERKRDSTWAGGGAEGEGQKESSSRLPDEYGDWCGAWSKDSEIMTWVKIENQPLIWLSHPGALTIWDTLKMEPGFLGFALLKLENSSGKSFRRWRVEKNELDSEM